MLQHYLLKKKSNHIFKSNIISQFSFFSIASICSLFADLFTFSVLTFLGTNFLISQCIARSVGGFCSFYINRNLSFKGNKNNLFFQMRKFILLFIASYILSIVLIFSFHQILEFKVYIAKFMSDFLCFLFNFFVMKMYVYSNNHISKS